MTRTPPRVFFTDGPSLYCAARVGIVEGAGEETARLAEELQGSLAYRVPEAPLGNRDLWPPGAAVFRIVDERVAQLAGAAAMQILSASASDAEGVRHAFRQRAHRIYGNERGAALIDAAQARSIPWCRLAGGSSPIVQLGHGAAQRRLYGTITSGTSHTGTMLSTHKHLAAEVLRAAGLPAPRHVLVKDAAGARRAAKALGFPVVVKPSSADRGDAVAVGLRDADEVAAAFELARRYGQVLVEEQIPGAVYRLVVMSGSMVWAVRREPAQVVGDGTRSVRELASAMPALDDDALRILRNQGLAPQDVPAAGRKVVLRGQANRHAGGTYETVTAQVHRDNRLLAERAAAVIGLDVAGIDFLCPDIARSHLEVGGAICEVNANPGLLAGAELPVLARTMLEHLFPPPADGRIPLVCLLSDADCGPRLARIEQALAQQGHTVACTTPGEFRIGGVTVARKGFSSSAALLDPQATAAVMQLAYARARSWGLPFDFCTVALIDPHTTASAVVRDGVSALLRARARRVVDWDDAEGLAEALRAAAR